MRKKILFACMFLALVCMLCMGVMAQEATTYYLYDDGTAIPEGENNISVSELYWQSETETGLFANLKDGDNVVIELKESIAYNPVGTINNKPPESNCLRIGVAATVTVNFNGYSWWFTNSSGYDAFFVYNEGATLNLIGAKAKNPDGTIKEIGTDYTAAEINESIDVYSDFVVVYLGGGRLYCENLAASCREEAIYQKDGYLKGLAELELVDCSMLTRTNMYTVGLSGKNNCNNNIRIDGGLYGSICAHNLLDNSYIKNATVKETAQGNALYIDSWKSSIYDFPVENSTIDGRYWAEGDANVIVGKNSSFGIIYLRGDGSGGAFAELTDCTYESVDFTGNKGTGQLTVYTSPDCENAGTKTVYDINNTTGVVDESYEAPAIGHKFDEAKITGVSYENYLTNGIYTSKCAVCDAENVVEKEGTAPALFTFKGYSTPENDGVYGIVMSYIANKDAIDKYVSLGNTIEYGVVVAAEGKLGASNPLNENGEAVSSVVKAKLENNYSAFDFRITDIGEDQRDIGLVFAAYVIANGKVVYLQGTSQLENGLVAYSYDTVPKPAQDQE